MNPTASSYARERWAEDGQMFRYSAAQQKVLAAEFGCSDSYVSRLVNGERKLFEGYFDAVRRLAMCPKSEAGPIIERLHECLNELAEALAARLEETELRQRLYAAHQREAEFQAAEDMAQHRVMVALGYLSRENATEDDLAEFCAASDAHREASRRENSEAHNIAIYTQALRCKWGLRVSAAEVMGGGA